MSVTDYIGQTACSLEHHRIVFVFILLYNIWYLACVNIYIVARCEIYLLVG